MNEIILQGKEYASEVAASTLAGEETQARDEEKGEKVVGQCGD